MKHVVTNMLSGVTKKKRQLMTAVAMAAPLVVHGNPSVVVIGGAVLDVVSRANKSLLTSTSNPGVINMQVGGVGRNITEGLVHLEVPSLLIAPVGADPAALTIRQWCHSNKMATSGLIEIASARTPVYSALMHDSGELLYGVIDSAIFEQFTVQHLAAFRTQIAASKWIVLDSNGSPSFLREALAFCNELRVPVFFEPVSVQKARNVADPIMLREISILCPNVREMLSICYQLTTNHSLTFEAYLDEGLKVTEVQGYKPYLTILLNAGVQTAVIVKLGARGVLLGKRASGGVEFHSYAALKANVANVLGAGDCLVAGIIYALIQGFDIVRATQYGLISAKLSVESPVPVPPSLNLAAVKELHAMWESLAKIES